MESLGVVEVAVLYVVWEARGCGDCVTRGGARVCGWDVGRVSCCRGRMCRVGGGE